LPFKFVIFVYIKIYFFVFLEIQNETINRELEKQFNEGLQSKILHTHHEGLGFLSSEPSTTSPSDDWHHQQMKTKFVPATTKTGSSSLNKTETKDDKSG
jgi:hypothetical protein